MAFVPPTRVVVDELPVRNGAPVSHRTWRQMARLNNWTLGSGGVLVPGYSPQVTLTAGTEYVFKYRVKPRYQSLERHWVIRGYTASAPAGISIEAPSGATAVTFTAVDRTERSTTWRAVEAVSSQSAAETELSLAITASDNDVTITSIACWEAPRATLVDGATNDRGHQATPFSPRQPIIYTDLQPAIDTLGDSSLIGTRPALISWAVPVTAGGSTTTSFASSTASTSYQDLWSLDIPILLRNLPTGPVEVKLLAWVTAGTGRFTIRSTGGTSYGDEEVSFTNTTPAWTSALTNTSLDQEDLSVADGRPASAWDDVNVGFKQVSSGTVYVAAAAFMEG